MCTFATCEVGLEGSKLVEIASGLDPGDRVILGGQDKYQEGETVSPIHGSSSRPRRPCDESGGTIDMKAEENSGGVRTNARRFRICKFPSFFIIMLCLIVALVGGVTVARMPVDLFPEIDMPVVVVATFYNGMPPEQIEADITNTFERFFTLAANVDHSESRSLTGVSLIKIYFKPGTDPNAALSNIANLAMADLRRLPPGTLPPVVLGMDCFHAARLPGDAQGRRAERNQPQRSCAVSGAQPDFERAGRIGSATVTAAPIDRFRSTWIR